MKSKRKPIPPASPLTAHAIGMPPEEAAKVEAEMNATLAASFEKMNCCERAAFTLGIRMFQYGIKDLRQLRELQDLLNHLIKPAGDGKLSISKALMDLMKKAEDPARAARSGPPQAE